MSNERIRYVADRPVSPGTVLSGVLEARGLQKQEFAIRCGRTPKLISEIISGTAPIVPETALQFQRVLNIPAAAWMKLEANYRLALKHQSEQGDWATHKDWLKKFPLKEIASRVRVALSKDPVENIEMVLSFFGVASIKACDDLFESKMEGVQYRRTAQFTNEKISELTWLRLGRLAAENIECKPFDAKKFKALLPELRRLTHLPMEKFLDPLVNACAEFGVAVVIVPELKDTRTSGASYWPTKDKAIIQLSNRGKTNDKFWFNFMHEAAHLLLHSKKRIYLDIDTSKNQTIDHSEVAKYEEEADEFAAKALISEEDYQGYSKRYTAARSRYSAKNLKEYSQEIGISPAILLGQLQKRGIIPWASNLNKTLKIALHVPDHLKTVSLPGSRSIPTDC
ncbi:MAG: ImmA/IrrE family metallo-endopeptidase [Alphaproteobacteria bacterium]|nr:ImmA/IrrE family metallo-endopeptidase [Alphaproteobacteria bacterium]